MPEHDDSNVEPATRSLEFYDDPGARRSAWIAGGLLVLVVLWFGSGALTNEESTLEAAADRVIPPVQVAVRTSEAERVAEALILEGQATPERETLVPAETSGRVVDRPVEKGATLAADALIARLDSSRLEAALRRAEAELERASREFANAQTLLERGIGTVDRVANARAGLASAEAQLAEDVEALRDAEIRAPFAGRLEDLSINAGEFVAAGAPVARIVDNTPLTVRARIAQQSVSRISVGKAAQVAFITGETGVGTVTFVGAHADAETRTFLVEVKVDNEDGTIPSGLSARIRIEAGETRAHFVSPALLALDEQGVLGLKAIGADNVVEFHEVAVVHAEASGVWVTGLPDTVTLITVGQGFVRNGETVDPRPEDTTALAGAEARP